MPSPVAALTAPVLRGPEGPPGAGGGGAQVVGESPGGVRNGTNMLFTLGHNFRAGTVAVYFNGLRNQSGADYHETAPNQITFTTAPESGDTLIVDYIQES